MKQVELAEQKLDAGMSHPMKKPYSERGLAGIRQDIRYQQLLHRDTFHGVFTLVALHGQAHAVSGCQSDRFFELLDQPEVIATRNAVHDLCDKVLASQDTRAQHDVVFVTDPADFADLGETSTGEYSLSTSWKTRRCIYSILILGSLSTTCWKSLPLWTKRNSRS